MARTDPPSPKASAGKAPPSREPSPDASARQAPPSPKASGGQGPPPHQYTDEEMHNVDVAHEHGDINVRMIVMSGVSLFAVAAFSALAMLGLFKVFERQAAARDTQVSPLAIEGDQPPKPRLQTNEPAGLRKFRAIEDEKLLNYGWVDEKAGVAHIPIEEAKKKLLERGLPTRATPTDGVMGTHAPAMGMSSSGRSIRVPRDK